MLPVFHQEEVQSISSHLIPKVRQFIDHHRLLDSGDHVLAGVSGGPDSVALVYILLKLQERYSLQITIAHINHGLRGEEADADQEFVEALADRLNLKCFTERISSDSYEKRSKQSIQEQARVKRLFLLNRMCLDCGANKIAFGHHADDQVETVLYRILSGTGVVGLSGIPLVSNNIIHPLLDVTREEIVEFLAEIGQDYSTDSSNLKTEYRRNLIRHEILPHLEKAWPSPFKANLRHLADILVCENDFIERHAAVVYQKVVTLEASQKKVDAVKLTQEHKSIQRRVIMSVLFSYYDYEQVRITFANVERLTQFLKAEAGKQIHLPGRLTVYKMVGSLIFTHRELASRPETVVVESAGVYKLSGYKGNLTVRTLSVEEVDTARIYDSVDTVIFDAEEMPFPLTIGPRELGDRMRPFGSKHFIKLKKLFQSDGVPDYQRDRYPIIRNDKGEIIWIPGIRRGYQATISRHTKNVLLLRWENDG